jgi:hypothetical protein
MHKNNFPVFSLCLILSVLSVSCGSPKDASKENFAKAVERSIKENPGSLTESGFAAKKSCFFQVGIKFPIKIVIPANDLGSSRPISKTLEQMEVLSKYGLFTSKTLNEEMTPYGKIVNKEYDITDQGKAKLMSSKEGNKFISYCKIAFKAVTSYEDLSASAMGKYADVKFTYVIEDVDAWAKDPAYHNLFPQAKAVSEMINQPIEGRMSIVFSNEAWINPQDSLNK